MTAPFGFSSAANDTWCIDFKGWFRTGDGSRCGPLTLSDAASRYLLRCQALRRDDGEHVWPVLEAAFLEYGLPLRLRSDNGPPFASTGAGGLSGLAVKLIKAGVTPERIKPGKPQQNGRLERLHLTLLNDVADPPAKTLRAQAKRFVDFQRLYNEERPHQALEGRTPSDAYAPSPRRFDGILREPEYGQDAIRRRVRTDGQIKWDGGMIYISQALAGEPIGLFEQEDGARRVLYGPVLLGHIEPKGERLNRPKRAARGLVDNPAGFPTTPPAQQQQQA
jgi:putative transposase